MFLGVDSLSSKSSAYFDFFVQEMMIITDSSLAVSFDFRQLGRRLVFRNLLCNIRNWHDNAPMEAWLWQPRGWIAPPKELIVNYNLTCGCRSRQGSSGADSLCWDLYLQVGLPFEKCKGTALTRNGDTERPVPEASSRPGSTLFVSFIYLFIFF